MLKQQAKPSPVWNMALHTGKTGHLNGEHPARSLSELARLAVFVIVALAMMASTAVAETVNSTEWGFNATFPGQSKISAVPLQTDLGNITMVNFTFENDTQAFMIAVNDYPKGSITSPERSYNGAIEGFANGVKGKLRNRSPYILGNIAGFDFLVDGPPTANSKDTMVFHVRTFIVGDRLYQVAYGGPKGTEQNFAVLSFLNSFKLR